MWFLIQLLSGFLSLTAAYVSHQFYFVNEAKSWTEAQSYCRSHYTDLATLFNTDDVNALTQLGSPTGSAWIGLYDDLIDSWRWSITNSSFYGPGETEFRNWNTDVPEPNNHGGQELCAEMLPDGKWNDIPYIPAYEDKVFVCYVGANDSYVLIQKHISWNDAQSYCRANYTDLPSIRNAAENEKVRDAADGNKVHIGLYRTRTWSDSSDSSFRNWNSSQPDNLYGGEHCTAMSFSDAGQWTDEDCATTRPFFCYRDTVVTLRAVVDATEELTEAEIEETILKPLREELIRNGLPNSTSLRLRRVYQTNP
ncbi:putative C-type lectin domain family 20 member A [Engraulis encrasicolus]|uniref:putative C-type lectin domain family 20 member A n=1 Tax=Engraulis encrasicolus TaxID=184585 RepID=UPI002FD29AC4